MRSSAVLSGSGAHGRFVFDAVGCESGVTTLLGAVAALLTRRGYECHLLATEKFDASVLLAGIQFGAVAEEMTTRGDGSAREEGLLRVLPTVAGYFARLDDSRETVVVNTESGAATNLLAELYGLRSVRLHVAPSAIRSCVEPAWPHRAKALGHLGQTFLRYELPRVFAATDRAPHVLAATNRARLSMGLPPLWDLHRAQYADGHVALFPTWYAAPASDWPRGLECVGFAFPESGEQAPDHFLEFMAREGRPIVFLPGESNHLVNLPALASQCCAELSMPGVVLGSSAGVLLGSSGTQLAAVNGLDVEAALKHAALLVHPGDTITTARALRAGVPQIVLPAGLDQPDNAQRVFNLGVGRYLAAKHTTGKSLSLAARDLLGNAHVPRAAQTLQQRISDDGDALGRAANAVEAVLAASNGSVSAGSRALRRSEQALPTSVGGGCPAGAGTQRSRLRSTTTLFIVWPELGHVTVPLALARRLTARGDHVVFASIDGLFSERLASFGYDTVDLSRVADWSPEAIPTAATSSDASQLRVTATRLSLAFEAAIERYRPSAVLIDTLYSSLGILPQSAGIPWAIYETDLPRDFDPSVPPKASLVVPGRTDSAERLRDAWRAVLRERLGSKRAKGGVASSPRTIIAALQHRHGHAVRFDRHLTYPPVARAPRIVFAPRAFDFPRSRTANVATWLGSCIDEQRCEPEFPWHALPQKPFVYCAFGSQSLRDAQAPGLLQMVADVFRKRDDYFLVLVCPDEHRPAGVDGHPNVLIVQQAPQLALLRRARFAITHAGFNSLKECAAHAVPVVALPLSNDQPRNAALVEYLGLGVAFDTSRQSLTIEALDAAIDKVSNCPSLRENCRRLQRHFVEPGFDAALQFIDTLCAC